MRKSNGKLKEASPSAPSLTEQSLQVKIKDGVVCMISIYIYCTIKGHLLIMMIKLDLFSIFL